MKALILAAGLGSRLAPLTNECPKSLVEVNGTPILFKQIENLHENGITEIIIVSGYKAEVLEERVRELYPEITIIRSKDYDTTNNMYSAYLASRLLTGKRFLMMNADVFFDSNIIRELLDCSADSAIVTDVGTYYEESMKVVEKDGRLTEISKKISKENALGSSIDVYKFSEKSGEAFFKKCQEYIESKKELKLWSEVALNDILKDEIFEACPLKGRWMEIDNLEDLKMAEEIFSTQFHR